MTQTHLFLDIVERVGRVDGKADKDNVRVGVRQRTESVIVYQTGQNESANTRKGARERQERTLLSSRIPKRELDALPIDLDIRNIVLKHGRDVHLLD